MDYRLLYLSGWLKLYVFDDIVQASLFQEVSSVFLQLLLEVDLLELHLLNYNVLFALNVFCLDCELNDVELKIMKLWSVYAPQLSACRR